MRRLSRAAQAFVLCGAVGLVGSCGWVDPFDDYREVNLIERRGLSVANFQPAVTDSSAPANYITLTALTLPAEYGSTVGLPDTTAATLASIHRLETLNLLPNGDFEDGTTNPWLEGVGATAPPDDFTWSNAGELTGGYVGFNVSPGQGAVVDLDLLPVPVETGGIYFVQARFQRADNLMQITFDHGDDGTTSYLAQNGTSWVFEEPNGTGTPEPEEVPDRSVARLDVPFRFTVFGTPNYLFMGSPASGRARAQAGYLDDVRIGRLDNLPHVEIAIARDGDLPLVPGVYTFSVYVKAEVDGEVTPATPNRFRTERIALGANGRHELFRRVDHGWSATAWVRLAATVEYSTEQAEAGEPLVLQMTTITPLEPAVGSILIARPELTLGRR